MESTRITCPQAAATVILLGVAVFGTCPATLEAQNPPPIRIGMTSAFFVDQTQGVVKIATNDFKEVLKQTTGLRGELTSKDDVFAVVQKLQNKALDFGIVHAHEFAWVRKKHPDLHPLLIAANKRHEERVYLIVRKSLGAKSIDDLRGKKLDVPRGANEPCRVFLTKICAAAAQKPPVGFFGSIVKSESLIDGLDQTARGKTDATVVDTATLEFYKEVKSAVFAKNLVVLRESEVFPPAVILYRAGGVDSKILARFRNGLLKAHETEMGRDMMKEWNIDAFAPIPKDFDDRLTAILKAYPSPKN
ncbi:MAG: PhnD/SsuA/transferrin family substrate-binding protein [Planctomycetes bacterium]|nr:PhnD/SsuA/transferrin family substrate-binding protein [Planctomycetota bacterium]